MPNVEQSTSPRMVTDAQTLMPGKQINVVIVDDYPGVRAGLRNLLRAAEDIAVVGEAGNGADALALAETKRPHLMLLDMELPDLRGDMVVHKLQAMKIPVKVLAVSSYSDRQYVQSMIRNGASGYITKDETPDMLLIAIRTIVYDDENWISPLAKKNSQFVALEEQTLTIRELNILRQLVLDQSEEEIAEALDMDVKQLERYLKLLMLKFEADSLTVLKRAVRPIFFPPEETK